MKLLVISDSHGSKKIIDQLLELNNYNAVLFLGDGLKDVEHLSDNIYKVAGNCDIFNCNEPSVRLEQFCNKKLLLTHGHLFNAKYNLYGLIEQANIQNADIVCFGHTHKQLLEEQDNITLLNPGSLKNGDYAEIDIINNKINITLHNFYNFK